MIRAVAPHLRRQNAGRIINLSSIAGKLVSPANGLYSATKFALKALSDAMRFELAPFGIHVVAIEPGAIQTSFMDTVQSLSQDRLANPASPYEPLYKQYQRVNADMTRQTPRTRDCLSRYPTRD